MDNRMIRVAFALVYELARTQISPRNIKNRVQRVTGVNVDGRTIVGIIRTANR